MLNYEETRESRNTRLTHEISEVKDKILEREREREREQKSNHRLELLRWDGSI